MLAASCSATYESIAVAARWSGGLPTVLFHVWLAVCYALGAIALQRRFGRDSMPVAFAGIGPTAVLLVPLFAIVREEASGDGGLGAMVWFFGIAFGVPIALVIGMLTTWLAIRRATFSPAGWCVAMALLYVPMILAYEPSHW